MIVLKYLICFLLTTQAADIFSEEDVLKKDKIRYLDPASTLHYTPRERHRGFFETELRTYCYTGNFKTLTRLFETIELQLDIDGDDYTQYEGATPSEVREHYEEQHSLFSFSLFTQKRTRLQMSPFEQQCIGIVTMQPYRLHLQQLRIDFWRVIQLLIGVFVFNYARPLSQNAIFYYIIGVLIGICSSFMLLIWLSSKLLPRRTMVYGAMIGGWTIGLYVIQMLWQNLQTIILTYRTYVFWYIFVTGLISFFFCYRWGPPKNKRSKNIIKWCLQLLALGVIYASSYFEEATIAIGIVTVLIHYFPISWWFKLRGYYLRRFPPKRRLLTNAEYYEEGVRETTKALNDLRSYASSPECKQWRVMSKLSNPRRFAAFVEGSSHLRDEEILQFENTLNDDDQLDVSSDDEVQLEDDEDDMHYNVNQNLNYTNKRLINHTVNNVEISDDEDVDDDEDDHDNTDSGDEERYRPELSYVEVPRRTPQSGSSRTIRPMPNINVRSPANGKTNRASPLAERVVTQQRTPSSRSSIMVQQARAQTSPSLRSNVRRNII